MVKQRSLNLGTPLIGLPFRNLGMVMVSRETEVPSFLVRNELYIITEQSLTILIVRFFDRDGDVAPVLQLLLYFL